MDYALEHRLSELPHFQYALLLSIPSDLFILSSKQTFWSTNLNLSSNIASLYFTFCLTSRDSWYFCDNTSSSWLYKATEIEVLIHQYQFGMLLCSLPRDYKDLYASVSNNLLQYAACKKMNYIFHIDTCPGFYLPSRTITSSETNFPKPLWWFNLCN